MAIIDPEGLFGGDRLRLCSNLAQLHWPRIYLASDGFGRIEVNYARIVGRAYPTFDPIPPVEELMAYIQEYVSNWLLFVWTANGQNWGQWDTRLELLPRYKTSQDRRSPIPPEKEYTVWKSLYRSQSKEFPKSFRNFSPRVETFPSGVGVGVGVGVEKAHTNACVLITDPKPSSRSEEFWNKYPRKVGYERAMHAWCFVVTAANETQVFACLERYLASDEVSRGVVMSGEKWLNSQSADAWAGIWPTKNGDKEYDEAIRRLMKP